MYNDDDFLQLSGLQHYLFCPRQWALIHIENQWQENLRTVDGRKKFLKAWQERKQEPITHPYLQEKIPWGLVPYVQALLLARCLRGDLDGYPPFLWK